MINKNQIIKEIYDGVKSIANKKSSNKHQAEDFLQEGLIAAFQVINKYQDKSESELIKICAATAYNKISKIQTSEINWNRGNTVKSIKKERPIDNWEMDENVDPSDGYDIDFNYDMIDEKQFIMVAKTFLSDRGQQILDEKLNPSLKTIQIRDMIKNLKLEERSKGKLVMNINNDKISDIHIAKSLKISKATMSRELNHIKEVVLYLKHGLFEPVALG